MSALVAIAPDVEVVAPRGRVAVVGAGAFGRFCIDAYQRYTDLDVVVVADPDEAVLAQVVSPGTDLVTDWHDVVARADVEVIHIAAPPWLRGEIVDEAVAARKSVFCEKPLALTLDEADSMIQEASRAGVALGVDYVMRHHPAFRLLYAVAGSGVLGDLRSISVQNFAQDVPPDHWFWDRERSGGMLLEHGVHFFDAYGHVAEPARCVRGDAPRRESVEVTVEYGRKVIGRYYHEFAFPKAVERTHGIVFFESGFVEIDGWIPQRVQGAALGPIQNLQEIATEAGCSLEMEVGDVTRFSTDFGDRSKAYGVCIVSGMRDVVHQHRDHAHRMEVSPADARQSIIVALTAQQAIDTGRMQTLGDKVAP